MKGKILVIGAHPDDETLGVGGTIVKSIASGAVAELCIVTAGYEPWISRKELDARRNEALAASKILGFSKTHFLELPAAHLDTLPQKQINDALSHLIENFCPDTIYTTGNTDINKDHRIVYDATMVAARPKPGSSVKRLLTYELPSSTEWGGIFLQTPFQPNVFVDISETLGKKLEAMAAYTMEIKQFPHPRSLENIKAVATMRGASVGLVAAEAFRLIYDLTK
jgi:LmbE family N-acetylglucosaminyl deacetylase